MLQEESKESEENFALMKKYVNCALYNDSKILISHSQVNSFKKSGNMAQFYSYMETICFNMDPKLMPTVKLLYSKFGDVERFYKVVPILINRELVQETIKKKMMDWNWTYINYLEEYRINSVEGMQTFYFQFFLALITELYADNPKKRHLNATFYNFSALEWLSVDNRSLFKAFIPFQFFVSSCCDLDPTSMALERKIEFILNNYTYGRKDLESIFYKAYKSYRLQSIPLLLESYPLSLPYLHHLKCFPNDAIASLLNQYFYINVV